MLRENNSSETDLLDAELKELEKTEEYNIGDFVELTSDGRQGKVIQINDPNLAIDKQLPYNTVRVKFTDGMTLVCQINHLKKIERLGNEKELTN